MALTNIFDSVPRMASTELVEVLATLAGAHEVRVERIVSFGARAPEEGSFAQEWTEMVFLLHGGATLVLDDPHEIHRMTAGDCVVIAPGRRHVVEETSRLPSAVWLAIHVK
jgi:mannose-6-phosphate isomerase-like protein (cupin superfamily)